VTIGQAFAISAVVLVPILIGGRLLVLRSQRLPLTRTEAGVYVRILVGTAVLLLIFQLPLSPVWLRVGLIGFALALIAIDRRVHLEGPFARATVVGAYGVLLISVILLVVSFALPSLRG